MAFLLTTVFHSICIFHCINHSSGSYRQYGWLADLWTWLQFSYVKVLLSWNNILPSIWIVQVKQPRNIWLLEYWEGKKRLYAIICIFAITWWYFTAYMAAVHHHYERNTTTTKISQSLLFTHTHTSWIQPDVACKTFTTFLYIELAWDDGYGTHFSPNYFWTASHYLRIVWHRCVFFSSHSIKCMNYNSTTYILNNHSKS